MPDDYVGRGGALPNWAAVRDAFKTSQTSFRFLLHLTIMGGSLFLKHISTGIPKEPDDYDTDEDDEPYWSFSYSGFHWFKGKVLRGGIAYLEHLHTSAKEKEAAPEGAKQFFLDAGIKAVVEAEDDEAAAKGAAVVISGALQVLNEWKREERGTDRLSLLAAFGGSFPGAGTSLEDMLDAPYHAMKIMTLLECPLALERVGMRGMYFLMRLSDNNQLVYSEAAQMMASIVERVMEQGKAVLKTKEDSETFEEMATEFSQLMKQCKDGTYIKG
ncbi:hypothetical protein BDZ89DRAFT_1204115 [Hymenopellis radicata]|nr:hypothetical protein BDZ89DRAFT_1204115 [Hymenopellis radicata]